MNTVLYVRILFCCKANPSYKVHTLLDFITCTTCVFTSHYITQHYTKPFPGDEYTSSITQSPWDRERQHLCCVVATCTVKNLTICGFCHCQSHDRTLLGQEGGINTMNGWRMNTVYINMHQVYSPTICLHTYQLITTNTVSHENLP